MCMHYIIYTQVTSSEDDGKMLICEASLKNSKMNPVSTMIEISVLCKCSINKIRIPQYRL